MWVAAAVPPHASNTSFNAAIIAPVTTTAAAQANAARRLPAAIRKISTQVASGSVTALSSKSVTKSHTDDKTALARASSGRCLRDSGLGRLEYHAPAEERAAGVWGQMTDGYHQIGTIRMAAGPAPRTCLSRRAPCSRPPARPTRRC